MKLKLTNGHQSSWGLHAPFWRGREWLLAYMGRFLVVDHWR